MLTTISSIVNKDIISMMTIYTTHFRHTVRIYAHMIVYSLEAKEVASSQNKVEIIPLYLLR